MASLSFKVRDGKGGEELFRIHLASFFNLSSRKVLIEGTYQYAQKAMQDPNGTSPKQTILGPQKPLTQITIDGVLPIDEDGNKVVALFTKIKEANRKKTLSVKLDKGRLTILTTVSEKKDK